MIALLGELRAESLRHELAGFSQHVQGSPAKPHRRLAPREECLEVL
jgi:hypothetical protein